MPAPIDWDTLRAVAAQAAERSYSPYSGLAVGAAAICTDGSYLSATNVENASYVAGICAETALVGLAVATGRSRGDLVAVAVTGDDGRPLSPCGRCRQLLHEMGGPGLLVNERTMGDWLPDAFGPGDVAGAGR